MKVKGKVDVKQSQANVLTKYRAIVLEQTSAKLLDGQQQIEIAKFTHRIGRILSISFTAWPGSIFMYVE